MRSEVGIDSIRNTTPLTLTFHIYTMTLHYSGKVCDLDLLEVKKKVFYSVMIHSAWHLSIHLPHVLVFIMFLWPKLCHDVYLAIIKEAGIEGMWVSFHKWSHNVKVDENLQDQDIPWFEEGVEECSSLYWGFIM